MVNVIENHALRLLIYSPSHRAMTTLTTCVRYVGVPYGNHGHRVVISKHSGDCLGITVVTRRSPA